MRQRDKEGGEREGEKKIYRERESDRDKETVTEREKEKDIRARLFGQTD